MRIDAIHRAYDVKINYVHFPLHPDTPLQGKSLEALFKTNANEIAKKNAHMKELMDTEGLPYGVRTHTYNSRMAQELAAWAVTQQGGDAIHQALFEAYFVATQNVADKNVLLEVIDSIDLNVDEAEKVFDERLFKPQVDIDWEKSHKYGVTGVPTYVAGKSGVVGAQPYEAIERLIIEAGAVNRV